MVKKCRVVSVLWAASLCVTAAHAGTSGYYGGVLAAFDEGRMRISNSADEGYHAPMSGQDGGALLGYEWVADAQSWHPAFGVEVSATKSNAQYKQTNKRAVELRTYSVTDGFSIGVLPGVTHGDQHYFARAAWKTTALKHQEVATAVKRSPAFSKHPSAKVLGVGVESFIDSHWAVRAEVEHDWYKGVASSEILDFEQKLDQTQTAFSVVWHAIAPPGMGSTTHYFKDGWHVGAAVGADMGREKLGAVDSNDNVSRSYAMRGQHASLLLGHDWRSGRRLGLGVELAALLSNADSPFNSGGVAFQYKHDRDVTLSVKPTWHNKRRNLAAFVEAGAAISHIQKTGAVVASSLIPPNRSQWYPGYVLGLGANIMVDAANAIGLSHRYVYTKSHNQTDGAVSYQGGYRGQLLSVTWSRYLG